MADLWNRMNLDMPPINTAKICISNNEIQCLYAVIAEAIERLKDHKSLSFEAAMLSRMIYRMKYKFRHDKGFKCMEKVNRALLQFNNVKIVQELSTFLSMIEKNDFGKQELHAYLPTLQMLQFILVRLQGLAKLFCRIGESCRITANYMQMRLSSGQSWLLALLVMSLVSRILVIVQELIQFTCQWYNILMPYTQKLQLTGSTWLPSDYVYPVNLLNWLDIDWIEKLNDDSLDKINNTLLEKFFGSSVETNESVNVIETLNLCEENDVDNELKRKIETFDFGEVVTRSEFSKMEIEVSPPQKKKKQNIKKKNNEDTENKSKQSKFVEKLSPMDNKIFNVKTHHIESIKDADTLETFLKMEDTYRQKKSSKAVTQHLDLLQWRILQKFVMKLRKKILRNDLKNNEKAKIKIINTIKKTLTNNIIS